MTENKISPAWLLRVIFAILIIFAFTAGYFWSHKPVELSAAMVLAQTIFSILVWLLVLWLASAIGMLILPQRLFEDNQVTHLALASGLGLGLLSLLIFGLGILGWLTSWIAWLSLIIVAGVLRKQLKMVLSELRQISLPKPQNTFQKWIWVFGALMFFIAFTNALAPPTAWDSLLYHIAAPKLYIDIGYIGHPFDFYSLGFPPLGTMQFLYAILLAGERTAALFHFTFGILSLIIIAETARRYFGEEVAWNAALILITIPTFISLIGVPYTDAILLFFSTAALYIFLRWREKPADIWLLPLGMYLGFDVGVKYTAVAIPFTIALLIFWASRKSGVGSILRRLSMVTVVAVLIAAPYLLENLFTTGNPFYPFFIDSGKYWDAWRSAFYDRAGTGFASTDPIRLLIAPIEATILGFDGAAGYQATIGPLLFPSLFLLPFAWTYIKEQEQKTLGYIFIFIGISYVLWLFGLARSGLLVQSRLLMPVFGAMAVAGGLALARIKQLTRPQLEFRWLINMVLYINMALLMITAGFAFLQDNPIPVVVGLETEQAFWERRLGLYILVMQELKQLPEDARVQFLWEPRSYHCEIDCRPDALLDAFLHQTKFYERDAAGIAADWRAQGITHILLNQVGMEAIIEGGGDPIEAEDLAILDELQNEQLELVEDFNGAYLLLKLPDE